jgi:hypothetical protein
MAQGGLPHYGAQKKYVSSQAEEGMVRVSVWVPKEDRTKVLKYCRKVRSAASKRAAE